MTRADGTVSGSFSRAYLHHLNRSGEILSPMLSSIHNLHDDLNLMAEVHTALDAGTFGAFWQPFKTTRTQRV